MKLNKIIAVLALLVVTGSSVLAESTSPVVTERQKIEKQIDVNENVQKAVPQHNSTSVSQPTNVKTVTPPVKRQYSKAKMGVTMYPSRNNQATSQARKSGCAKCRYPKKIRVYMGSFTYEK